MNSLTDDGGVAADPGREARTNRLVHKVEEKQRLRWAANLIGLWALCGNAACRRARRCRGEPRNCLSRYAPLVPEEAREAAKCLAECRFHGMSFEEVCDECPEAIEDLGAWYELIEQSARKA